MSVKIPPSKLPEFSKAYFDMFVKYDNGAGRVFMDRRDPQVGVVDSPVVVYGGGFSESCRVVAAVELSRGRCCSRRLRVEAPANERIYASQL